MRWALKNRNPSEIASTAAPSIAGDGFTTKPIQGPSPRRDSLRLTAGDELCGDCMSMPFTKWGSQFQGACFNQIQNIHTGVHHIGIQLVVTANSDTLFLFVWLDSSSETHVISIPAAQGPLITQVMLTDSHTYNYGYLGSRCHRRQGRKVH